MKTFNQYLEQVQEAKMAKFYKTADEAKAACEENQVVMVRNVHGSDAGELSDDELKEQNDAGGLYTCVDKDHVHNLEEDNEYEVVKF